MTNIPPFYPGQTIVCVDTSFKYADCLPLKKDEPYTTIKCMRSPCCNHWLVDVGIKLRGQGQYCNRCGDVYYPDNAVQWFRVDRFVPIEQTFQQISFVKVIEKEQILTSSN